MADDDTENPVPALNPVVAFIIGLAIILLASILNAAGLNLTKLDHVRTSAIPKESRRKDWQRPLWLLGMILYILSQLIGSTLALEYMRAEYVAPLGSSSLVFNFLFARFLVGTPVTATDIYGTVVVILGVIGIVAFGSINSGLALETDVNHLTHLWRRGGWLAFFFVSVFVLICSIVFVSTLDTVLTSRGDLSSVPFAGMRVRASRDSANGNASRKQGVMSKILGGWRSFMLRLGEMIESWTAAKDDRTLAWALGIGWACIGGGLAGGTLVFAKATVKLISGHLTHQNPGNQFGHVAPIFTIIFLASTAVLQIICLNRGLKVYDSTLVVPVFYGVYTATGFLDSLIFNDEVDAYKPWVLFLIFLSIGVLVSGVILLTHKKPDHTKTKAKPGASKSAASGSSTSTASGSGSGTKRGKEYAGDGDEEEEMTGLRNRDEEERGSLFSSRRANGAQPNQSLVDLDLDEDDEDADHHQHPLKLQTTDTANPRGVGAAAATAGEEGRGLMTGSRGGVGRTLEDSSSASLSSVFGEVTPVDEVDERNPFRDDDPFRDGATGLGAVSTAAAGQSTEEFGEWKDAEDDGGLPTPRADGHTTFSSRR